MRVAVDQSRHYDLAFAAYEFGAKKFGADLICKSDGGDLVTGNGDAGILLYFPRIVHGQDGGVLDHQGVIHHSSINKITFNFAGTE
jgi:hypothetical protein